MVDVSLQNRLLIFVLIPFQDGKPSLIVLVDLHLIPHSFHEQTTRLLEPFLLIDLINFKFF